MEFPKYFTSKIIRAFGEKGRRWINDLNDILTKCIHKWQLTDVELSENLSYNLICFAVSEEYGDVVLKIGVPHNDLYTEMESIQIYNGEGICKCYDIDKDFHAMLLERIKPGTTLKQEMNDIKRMEVVSRVMNELVRPIHHKTNLPTKKEQIDQVLKRAKLEKKVDTRMYLMMDEVINVYNELEANNEPLVLLHGDLHHENILKDHDGYKAIDPKGVLGFRILEIGRFIQNELYEVEEHERENHLVKMIDYFSEHLHDTKRAIMNSIFIDGIVSTLWSYEDNALPENLKENVNRCEMFYKLLKKIQTS